MSHDAGLHSRAMHFAIAIATISPEVDFRHAVRMAKIGLLYADSVTLYSLDAAMYRAVETEGLRPPLELLDSHRGIWPRFIPNAADRLLLSNGVAQYKYLRKKKKLTPRERSFVDGMNDMLTSGPFIASIDEVLEKPGGLELKRIMDSGFVDVHEFRSKLTLDVVMDDALRNAAVDDIVEEYIEGTIAAIENGMTYPLLDDLSAQSVDQKFRESPKSLSEHDIWRSQYAALAGEFIGRLPLFEEASVDEILDIRRTLDTPLRKFRSGVSSFTTEIKSAPWNKDFHTEAERLFLSDIEPAILELEESIQLNNPLHSIAKRAASAGVVAGGGVTLHTILSSLHQFPVLASASLLCAPIGKVAKSAYDVYEEWRRNRNEIERNQLYFWVETKRRLK